MLKKALLGLSLLSASYLSSASMIVSEAVVTGADMVGVEVTVNFSDGSNETALWQMITNTPLSTGDPIQDMNGFSGGASGAGWAMTQAGVTLGGFDDFGNAYGMWTLDNQGAASDITGFSISGLAASIAFDIVPVEFMTRNSLGGQAYVSDNIPMDTSSYSGLVDTGHTDMYWNLDVTFANALGGQDQVNFFADTDAIGVSEPATLAFVLAGMALFTRRLSRK